MAASNPETALLTGADYVPSPMDTSMLTSQLVVLGFTGVMVAYWWYVLVPGARVNLAVNKKSGKLRDYLEELKDDDSRAVERFFYQKWLAKVDPETRFLLREDGSTESGEGDQMERGTNVSVKTVTRLQDTEGGVTRRWKNPSRTSYERRGIRQSFGAGITPCWWEPRSRWAPGC